MNKKQAIAYAQITLDFMQSSKYNGIVNTETLGLEIKQVFNLYPRDIVFHIANSQIQASKKLKNIQDGSDSNEQQ